MLLSLMTYQTSWLKYIEIKSNFSYFAELGKYCTFSKQPFNFPRGYSLKKGSSKRFDTLNLVCIGKNDKTFEITSILLTLNIQLYLTVLKMAASWYPC